MIALSMATPFLSNTFLEKYADNRTVREFIALSRREEALYNKYKDYYGYVFYIARKTAS